jgi:hypothetical protein
MIRPFSNRWSTSYNGGCRVHDNQQNKVVTAHDDAGLQDLNVAAVNEILRECTGTFSTLLSLKGL